jgi:hypothetical protein
MHFFLFDLGDPYSERLARLNPLDVLRNGKCAVAGSEELGLHAVDFETSRYCAVRRGGAVGKYQRPCNASSSIDDPQRRRVGKRIGRMGQWFHL